MTNDLIIIGASGFGREVAWLVKRINAVKPTWNLIGFMDDNEDIQNTVINGYKVIGKTDDINQYPDACFSCAVGSSKKREKIVEKMKEINPDVHFGTLMDPTVILSDSVKVGEGTIICAHTVLTVNISVGDHVIINLDCTIGHDSIVQDYATLYPGVNVSGATNVGHATELGTGMQIIQGKRIGNYSIVGAGAVVVEDIPDKSTAVGNPAKPIKSFE